MLLQLKCIGPTRNNKRIIIIIIVVSSYSFKFVVSIAKMLSSLRELLVMIAFHLIFVTSNRRESAVLQFSFHTHLRCCALLLYYLLCTLFVVNVYIVHTIPLSAFKVWLWHRHVILLHKIGWLLAHRQWLCARYVCVVHLMANWITNKKGKEREKMPSSKLMRPCNDTHFAYIRSQFI